MSVSVDLAKRLRVAGLAWRPEKHDLFHIPDRHLDDEVFVIADLSTDLTILADGIGAITFNGAVEWSLDYILTQEVVWLPTEAQLREQVGDRLVHLARSPAGFRCVISAGEETRGFEAEDAADAYALALLHLLDQAPPAGHTPVDPTTVRPPGPQGPASNKGGNE